MGVPTLAVTVLICLLGVPDVKPDAVPWNYKVDGQHGPDHWEEHYSDCGGKMQSPINVDTSRVLYNPQLPFFNLRDYYKQHNVDMQLVNMGGHTAEVTYTGTPIYIRGGGLPDDYKLDQFHFHWGKKDNRGSEHSLDFMHYPLEMHIVHHQHHLDNITEAAPHPYGLAVIGFLFTVGDHNENFDKLLDHFHLIRDAEYHNEERRITIPSFPLADLLPPLENMHFFRYYGSLTTPPCYETVIWSISTELIAVSEDQLNIFRSLFDEEHHQLVDDYRPLQELNHRIVTTNKKSYSECNMERGGNHGSTIGMSVVTGLLAASLASLLA